MALTAPDFAPVPLPPAWAPVNIVNITQKHESERALHQHAWAKW